MLTIPLYKMGMGTKGNGSFSERTGLIGAGIAQLLGGHSYPAWRENTQFKLYYFNSNIGITPVINIKWGEPYGDDPEDQKWIKRGYEYWDNHFKK